MIEKRRNPKRGLWLLGGGILVALVAVATLFQSAATITAQGGQFVTNTPPAPDPLAVTPDAPFEHYALRLWTERDLVEVLISQLNRLARGEDAQINALNLTLYELAQRFPGAPHHDDQRQRLLSAMLSAPRGSVDMRTVVRPWIIDGLNANLDAIRMDRENQLTVNGAAVETIPANLDGNETWDAVLELRYPAGATSDDLLLYKDFLPVIGAPGGGYILLPIAFNLPAAPYADIQTVRLRRVEDVNHDGLDEMVIGVATGEVNNGLLIAGWRNGEIASLIAPGQSIRYAEPPEWSADGSLTVVAYNRESATWNCQSWREETWEYYANYYRPSTAPLAGYRRFDTVGCKLLAEEPIFGQPVAEAIVLLHNLLEGTPTDEPGYDRGRMALAMLYYLAGQTDSATAQIGSVTALTEGNDWLTGQIEAFMAATASDVFDPLRVCEALMIQNENGACNLDQVLAQTLTENPIPRDADVAQQLEALGLPVLNVTTVSQVGRTNRIVVQFDLIGASWWAFAPVDRRNYVAEPTEPPSGFETALLPVGQIELPPSLYDLLLVEDDPVTALTILDNLVHNNPDLPLSAEALFWQAFCYDMLVDRQGARLAYYRLWRDYPDSAWGQLAGAHLERR